MKVSKWVMVDHCSMRYLLGSDPKQIENRVAFIEKTPRVRIEKYDGDWYYDFKNWKGGPKGCAPDYGMYQPSRDWCDQELLAMGYILTEET